MENVIKRLDISGTLNYEKVKGMDDKQLGEFIVKHVKDVLGRNPECEEHIPIIHGNDKSIYNVFCCYAKLDTHYNKVGHVIAVLTCYREGKDLVAELEELRHEK